MAEIVPVDEFLDVVSGLDARAHRRAVAAHAVQALHQGGRVPLLVRRLPLAARLLAARLPVRHRRAAWSHPDSPPTSCRCRRPAGSCSAWAGRSSTRARCPSRRSGRSASAPPASRRTCRKFLSNFDAIWDGAEVGARARSRLLRELRLRRQVAGRDRPVHRRRAHVPAAGRGRSTSRSCTRCSRIYLQLYGLCAGERDRPRQHRQDAAGSRLEDHGDRPGDVGPRRRGQAARHRRPLRRTSPTRSATRSPKAGGNASVWLTKFDDFLKVLRLAHRGHRRHQHPVVDREPGVAARPDPQLPRRWTSATTSSRSLAASHAERDEAIEAARSQLSGETLGALQRAARRSTPVANFAWWNEDHNYYIDLRASIPMRRGALAVERGGRRRHATTTRLFLFFPELHRGRAAGDVQWKDLQSIATARHEYYDHYQDHPRRRSRRSSARCPTRSRTPCSSRSSACTTTTSRR